MRRFATVALALVCALLVFDAPPDAASTAAVAAAPPGPTGTLGEEEIGEQLRSLNPSLTERQLRRIAAAVLKYSVKYDLEPELVIAVMRVESTARPWARSPKGAVGLMQVMPYMGAALDVAGNLTTVESNVEAGCMILGDNIRRLGEDEGISAYFWGSDIRGASYLQSVRAARAAIRGTAAAS
jgi:soluble lytic murein transglycosylase-like protein